MTHIAVVDEGQVLEVYSLAIEFNQVVISEVNKFLLGTDGGIGPVEKGFYQFSVNVILFIVVIFGQHIRQLALKQQPSLVVLIDMIPPD